MAKRKIVVVDYDPAWPAQFEDFRQLLTGWCHVAGWQEITPLSLRNLACPKTCPSKKPWNTPR